MRIPTIALSASLALLMASGASFAGRYVDQNRAMSASSIQSPTAAAVSTGYATGGRGVDLLHARQGVATEKAEFAVMDMGTARPDSTRSYRYGGRAIDYRY